MHRIRKAIVRRRKSQPGEEVAKVIRHQPRPEPRTSEEGITKEDEGGDSSRRD